MSGYQLGNIRVYELSGAYREGFFYASQLGNGERSI